MPYTLLTAIMALILSCSVPGEPAVTAKPALDSVLVNTVSVAHIKKVEMNILDTSDYYMLQNTFFIQDDTIYIHQYAQYDMMRWWDEQSSFTLQTKIPLSKNAPYACKVSEQNGDSHCRFLSEYYLSVVSEVLDYKGKVELLNVSDSSILFRQDIELLALIQNKFPVRYHYDGVEVALYNTCDLLYPPLMPRVSRRVIR